MPNLILPIMAVLWSIAAGVMFAFRIINHRVVYRYTDEQQCTPPCIYCGEPIQPNIDGVRGRWGHIATVDPACR